MKIGIDSFASAWYAVNALSSADAMEQLLDRIVRADEAGLDVFGIGEHHKKEFLDSAPAVILAKQRPGPNKFVLAAPLKFCVPMTQFGSIKVLQLLTSSLI